jgi:hypothetical protein
MVDVVGDEDIQNGYPFYLCYALSYIASWIWIAPVGVSLRLPGRTALLQKSVTAVLED